MDHRTARVSNPAGGLFLLTKKSLYFRNDALPSKCQAFQEKHPFGLRTQHILEESSRPRHSRSIFFVGAGATDMSVEAFVISIRSRLDGSVDSAINKLRVISAPWDQSSRRNENHVFFEAWIGWDIVISGETTDFSGSGNAARNELESVFEVLSKIYSLEIQRVQLKKTVDLSALYDTDHACA